MIISKKLNRHGFTLIEIVVTLAIFVILVGGSVPIIGGYIQNSKVSQMKRHEELVQKVLRQYYAYEGRFPQVGSGALDDAQEIALQTALKNITSTKINIDDYDYYYNDGTGSCTLELS